MLEHHGGTVEKFIGDAVMAVFGVPVVHEDDVAGRRAANEMRAKLERLNDELERRWGVRLEWRIGINTGEVVVGDPTSTQTIGAATPSTSLRGSAAARPRPDPPRPRRRTRSSATASPPGRSRRSR